MHLIFHVPFDLLLIEICVASVPLAAVACVTWRICKDRGCEEEESEEGESGGEMHFW